MLIFLCTDGQSTEKMKSREILEEFKIENLKLENE